MGASIRRGSSGKHVWSREVEVQFEKVSPSISPHNCKEGSSVSRGRFPCIHPVQIIRPPISGRPNKLKAVRWPGFWVCCAKNVFYEHGAVPEMKEGPSEPACRSRLQTAVSCFGPKGRGGERYGQKA